MHNNLRLLVAIVFSYFFPLMEKSNKKDQGKPDRSARFALPSHLHV